MRSHYTHVCYVKGWALGNKAQPLTRPPWNQVAIRVTFAGVQVWAWAHVALGTRKDITGTVAKMSA